MVVLVKSGSWFAFLGQLPGEADGRDQGSKLLADASVVVGKGVVVFQRNVFSGPEGEYDGPTSCFANQLVEVSGELGIPGRFNDPRLTLNQIGDPQRALFLENDEVPATSLNGLLGFAIFPSLLESGPSLDNHLATQVPLVGLADLLKHSRQVIEVRVAVPDDQHLAGLWRWLVIVAAKVRGAGGSCY
jgi:hypothetical protein